jgi:hypothetical protein
MNSRFPLPRWLAGTYAAILCLFFGEVYAAQILGMLGIYRAWSAIPLTLLLGAAAGWVYWRWGGAEFAGTFPEETALPGRLNGLLYALGAGLFLLLVLYPLAAWPYSPVSETLHWDAGAYHFPKAVELFKTGNVWDLTIPYGEFPFGYESALAFTLLLAGKETFFGSLHALTALFALLGTWLLARRYTRLPGGLLLFGICLVFLSELYIVRGNPFYILLDQAFMIGKNDLFLAVGVAAAVVHAPAGWAGGPASAHRAHLPGLTYATLLVLASKPAGMFVVAPLWLPVLWSWWQKWRGTKRFPARELVFAAALILPGGMWIVRNLVIIKTIFPEGVWVMNEWSIANNLTNPFFYAHLPRNFLFLLGVLLLALVSFAWRRKPGWRVMLIFVVLIVAFVFTPESGFQKTTEEPTRVAWRLGVALVIYELVVLGVVFEGAIQRGLDWLRGRRAAWMLLAGLAVVGSLIIVWTSWGHLRLNPGNDIVLRDEFREAVGVDGYHSPYDFVQRNIHNSIVEINGGVFYYIYGPGYNNRPTKGQYPLGRASMLPQLEAQYYVVIPHGDAFPTSAAWDAKWKLIYQDPAGLVFERR